MKIIYFRLISAVPLLCLILYAATIYISQGELSNDATKYSNWWLEQPFGKYDSLKYRIGNIGG